MKKFLYKLLPLILIFVFCFSTTIFAEDDSVYMEYYQPYSEASDGETKCINFFFENFEAITGGTPDEFKYIVIRCGDRKYDAQNISVYFSKTPIIAKPYSTTEYELYLDNGTNPRRCSIDYYPYNGNFYWELPSYNYPFVAHNASNYLPLYSSEDVFLVSGETGLWLRGVENSILDGNQNEDSGDNDFFFGAFEDFADFGEESAEHYNNAMNQTVSENSNSPNDSVFQKLLQAMTGSLTTNNSITQQISNQLQHFSEQFFNNFAQYSLGLMNDILNTLNEFTGKFDSLLEITGQLYESGLDAEGNFDVGTMLSYWFVPDVDGIKRSYDNTIGQINTFDVVTDTMLGFLSSIQEVEPVAPIFTIPAGTYGLLTIKEDILIKFDWFESWKPYTDPLIAAFIYVTFFWHLFKQLPGIISGSAATTASVGHFNDAAIKDANRKAKGG